MVSISIAIETEKVTGESVPVSKSPLTDEALDFVNLSAPSVHPDVARHFLFNGTKIIRARRPQGVDDDEAIALAVVVRTGFQTTKGALVRSMLFPKPSGFKFYRDSFRYISVMAIVAILGFIASFVNFVRLGVSLVLLSKWKILSSHLAAFMGFDYHQSSRLNHNCCTTSTTSYSNHWHKFRTVSAEKQKNFLH